MPQFLNEGNPGWGNALSSIGSSLANWGMNQMQIKQEREQKAQDLAREERLWKEHTDTALRLGVPEERIQQVRDAQTGKVMEIRQRLKRGSAVDGTASEWEDVGAPTEVAPKQTFEPTLGGVYTEGKGFTADPEAQKAILARQAAGAARTNITLPSQKQRNAYQEKIGEKDAETVIKWRDQALSAADVNSKLDAIEKITKAQQTGKAQEALAMAGQYFGTEAGANYQTFNAIVAPLVLQAGEDAKGAMSEKDRALFESARPRFGNDPQANAQIIGILRRANARTIDRFNKAQDWANDESKGNGSLQGFRPDFSSTESPAKQEGQGKSPFPDGTRLQGPGGKTYIVKNGQPVPL